MIWSSKIGIWDGDPCHYEILKERNNKKYVLKTCSLNKYENIFDKMAESFKFIEEDETVDWKTYRNKKYGFEVKYPSDWDSPLWQESKYRKGITFGCPEFDFEGDRHCPLSLSISKATTKNETIKNINNVGAYKKGDVIINKDNIPTIKEFTVDSREAITYHETDMCKETYTKIFDKKMTILFTNRCSVYEGKIFNQILSSFKFIEK